MKGQEDTHTHTYTRTHACTHMHTHAHTHTQLTVAEILSQSVIKLVIPSPISDPAALGRKTLGTQA